VYGALAALTVVHSRSRWRWTVLALPLLIPVAVAVSRVDLAAHRPSDVLAGLVHGLAGRLHPRPAAPQRHAALDVTTWLPRLDVHQKPRDHQFARRRLPPPRLRAGR
jgi:membrane-associated phospholipid phosphatase